MKSFLSSLRQIDRTDKTLSSHQNSKSIDLHLARTAAKRKKWHKGLNLLLLFSSVWGGNVLLDAPAAQAATTTLSFDQTPTLVSGTALTQGAVYRYQNAASGIDAMVEIQTIQNAQLKNLDDNSTFPARFQPVIAPTAAALTNATSYVKFNFKLIPSSTPSNTSFAAAPTATATNAYFSAQDIDGNGGTNTIREFVEVIGALTTYLDSPTLLQTATPILGGTAYESADSINIQNGIGTDNRYEIYSYLGQSVSTFSIVGGNKTGSSGCTLDETGCDRQNSWTFDVSEIQKLDFGDAPLSFGNAFHPVPSSPTVKLGASVDGDDGPSYTAAANGDGADDDGVASFPALTSATNNYSLNVICAVNGAFVAGWIDFNKNNTFDSGERAAATCSGGNATLNWTGLSGLTTGSSYYARFRISSIASEVTSPTGQASNGEVEDYRIEYFSITGNVFADANGNKIQNSPTELGITASNLKAVLVNSNNRVVATTPIASNGSYTFGAVSSSVTPYTIRITTATVGSAPPAVTLPSDWVSTGENLAGTIDNTVDSILSVTVAGININGANFGIDRLPDTNNALGISQISPSGTTRVQVPNLTGTDPEDGLLGATSSFKIVTLPLNGKLYYGVTPVAVTFGQTITNYNPSLLTLDPDNGANTITFTYAAVDAAGKIDPLPATVSMPFTAPLSPDLSVDYGEAPNLVSTGGTSPTAPNSYKTTSSENGARHTIVSGVRLGATVTGEIDGQPVAYGNNITSSDNDGITFNPSSGSTNLIRASNAFAVNNEINVNASVAGFINGWIDYDQNGLFDTSEQIFSDIPVVAGNNSLNISVPTSVLSGATYARFRFTTATGQATNPTGLAPNGEVEDYRVSINKSAVAQCSTNQTPNLTALNFRWIERISTTQHKILRVGTLADGTLLDVLVTADAATNFDYTTGQAAPIPAPTAGKLGIGTPDGSSINYTFNFYRSGTTTPVPGNYVMEFSDIDGVGSTLGTPGLPTNADAERVAWKSSQISGYELNNTTWLEQIIPAPAGYDLQFGGQYGNSLSANDNDNKALRLFINNQSVFNVQYYGGNFGGINANPIGVTQITPSCASTPTPVTIAGTVFNDTNGNKVQNTPAESGTNAGGLNAVLVSSSNTVLQNVPVGTNGTYTFSNVPAFANYTVLITTGTTATVVLPTNWVSTGENLSGAIEGAVDSKLSVTALSSNITGVNFGIKQNRADVLLLKRITAINGLNINPNDNTSLTGVLVDPNWKVGYVVGAIDGGKVKPGDTIEYTIYYLNNGNRKAKSARICDRLNPNQSFQQNTYPDSTFIQNNTTNPNPVGSGMQIKVGTNNPLTLTNLSDGDGGQFIAATNPVTALPANCNSVSGAPNNDHGTLILDLVTSPGSPNLTVLPGKTSQGSPNESFGFWRFITKVNKVSP